MNEYIIYCRETGSGKCQGLRESQAQNWKDNKESEAKDRSKKFIKAELLNILVAIYHKSDLHGM